VGSVRRGGRDLPAPPDGLPDIADPGVWERHVPHQTFAWLRTHDPVSWWPLPDGDGFWAVTLHEDVRAVSRDVTTFSSRGGVISYEDLPPELAAARRTMLEEDPPRHTALRGLVNRDLLPRQVARHEATLRRLVAGAVERAATGEPVDAVATVAKQIPIRLLCGILGVPGDAADDLVRWGNELIGQDDPEYGPPLPAAERARWRDLPFGHPSSLRVFELAASLRRDRLARPRDDVLTRMATADAGGRRLTGAEFDRYFLMLVVAGNETTRHAISAGLLALAEHPDQWELLRRGGAAATAAEEVLRWSTPINFHRRTATRDVELRGRRIRRGHKLGMYYAAANRDERAFDRPSAFDVTRRPNDHLTFGRAGPHFCLGASLARLELRLLLEELAARVGKVELAGPARRLRSNHINGLKELPLRLG
jgi:cytochrome P450